jgi:hypothetical protein
MLITEIYNGQGLGNQLFCYVTTRVIADQHGYDFGIMSPEKFKGYDFLNLDFGKQVVGGSGPEGGPPVTLPDGITNYYRERSVLHPKTGADIRGFDEALTQVPDNTKIDGIMQDEQYLLKYRDQIRQWLAVKKEQNCTDYASDDTCVINFRGGEYTHHKELFLSKRYWNDAVEQMRQKNKDFRFVVVTDDVASAQKFFPDFEIIHNSVGQDYAIVSNAHYLILSNSSFAWFPAWLSTKLKFCIAPKYWARHNVSDGYWSCAQNLTTGWHYLDRQGKLSNYEACRKEIERYDKAHPELYPVAEKPDYDFDPSKYVTAPAQQPLVQRIISRLRGRG